MFQIPFFATLIMTILESAWIAAGVFIIIYYKFFGSIKKWTQSVLYIIKKRVRDLYLTIIESHLPAVFGYSYDREQDMFYTNLDSWQRKYGYCRLYDETTALSGMIVDCEPVYFDYGNKRWLIEFWKGQYDIATGFEIGVYNTDKSDIDIPGVFSGTFFNSAQNDELLYLSGELYKNSKLLMKNKGMHWWLTGFRLGEFSDPGELELYIKITLKDPLMLQEFIKGLWNIAYSGADLTINGNTVGLLFGRPHTPQPYTRTNKIETITQWKNKFLCDTFNELTGTSKTTPQKIYRVRRLDDEIYRRIKDMGKSKKTLDVYKKIETYLN